MSSIRSSWRRRAAALLEAQSEGQLQTARIVSLRLRHLAEAGRIDSSRWSAEPGCVREVKCFRTELEAKGFRQAEGLEKRCIDLGPTRNANVQEGAEGRQ